jgi:hypothetical protein
LRVIYATAKDMPVLAVLVTLVLAASPMMAQVVLHMQVLAAHVTRELAVPGMMELAVPGMMKLAVQLTRALEVCVMRVLAVHVTQV